MQSRAPRAGRRAKTTTEIQPDGDRGLDATAAPSAIFSSDGAGPRQIVSVARSPEALRGISYRKRAQLERHPRSPPSQSIEPPLNRYDALEQLHDTQEIPELAEENRHQRTALRDCDHESRLLAEMEALVVAATRKQHHALELSIDISPLERHLLHPEQLEADKHDWTPETLLHDLQSVLDQA